MPRNPAWLHEKILCKFIKAWYGVHQWSLWLPATRRLVSILYSACATITYRAPVGADKHSGVEWDEFNDRKDDGDRDLFVTLFVCYTIGRIAYFVGKKRSHQCITACGVVDLNFDSRWCEKVNCPIKICKFASHKFSFIQLFFQKKR